MAIVILRSNNYAYSVIMHAKYGQTLGKMFTGVMVLDVSERRLSLWQALLRDGFYIALMIVCVIIELPLVLDGENLYDAPTRATNVLLYGSLVWGLAEMVTMLTNSKRRALHDFIARSVVIRMETKPSSARTWRLRQTIVLRRAGHHFHHLAVARCGYYRGPFRDEAP